MKFYYKLELTQFTKYFCLPLQSEYKNKRMYSYSYKLHFQWSIQLDTDKLKPHWITKEILWDIVNIFVIGLRLRRNLCGS